MDCLVGFMYYLFHSKIISLLKKKRLNPNFSAPEINEVDVYQFDPSELPELSETKSDDQVWYFFCEPYYKYAKSKRAHRATGGGYWKITGKICKVKDKADREIGSKKTLVFCRRGCTSMDAKTDWVMHEFFVKDNSRYKKDFVACYIEKKKSKDKSNASTSDDEQSSNSLSSNSESLVTENPSTEVENQPSNHQLISDLRNHITDNSFLEVETQLLSSNNLISDPINHFPETTLSMVEPQLLSSNNLLSDPRNYFPENNLAMVEPQLLASNNIVIDTETHFPEITFSMVKPQLLSSNNLDYDPRNHFPGSPFSMVEPQLLSSDNLFFDPRKYFSEIAVPIVDPQLLAQSDAINGCNWLNHSSLSEPWSPIYPHQAPKSSSCSTGFSNDCNVWGTYQLNSELEDDVNSQWDFQDKYPCEVTAPTFPPAIDTVTINALMNELYEDVPSIESIL